MPPKKRKEVALSQLSCLVPEDVHEAVRELSDETGIPISRLTADALRLLLAKHGRGEKPGHMDRYRGGSR